MGSLVCSTIAGMQGLLRSALGRVCPPDARKVLIRSSCLAKRGLRAAKGIIEEMVQARQSPRDFYSILSFVCFLRLGVGSVLERTTWGVSDVTAPVRVTMSPIRCRPLSARERTESGGTSVSSAACVCVSIATLDTLREFIVSPLLERERQSFEQAAPVGMCHPLRSAPSRSAEVAQTGRVVVQICFGRSERSSDGVPFRARSAIRVRVVPCPLAPLPPAAAGGHVIALGGIGLGGRRPLIGLVGSALTAPSGRRRSAAGLRAGLCARAHAATGSISTVFGPNPAQIRLNSIGLDPKIEFRAKVPKMRPQDWPVLGRC